VLANRREVPLQCLFSCRSLLLQRRGRRASAIQRAFLHLAPHVVSSICKLLREGLLLLPQADHCALRLALSPQLLLQAK
jgi:hypothetical protein